VGGNPYQYSLDLQGIQNSGLDPELDIWR